MGDSFVDSAGPVSYLRHVVDGESDDNMQSFRQSRGLG